MTQFKIAKDGFDAETETDERNFTFNQKNIYKIAFTGDLSLNVSYVDDGFGGAIGEGTVSFDHNLGYVPIAFAFWKDFGMQIPHFSNAGAGIALTLSYKIDNDKIYITVYDTGVMGWIGDTIPFDFRYQIMYDKIT